jgi:2'-5' RNA ligase
MQSDEKVPLLALPLAVIVLGIVTIGSSFLFGDGAGSALGIWLIVSGQVFVVVPVVMIVRRRVRSVISCTTARTMTAPDRHGHMRLFVSVDLPDSLAEAVAAAQEPLRDAAGLSFTDPTQAHVTLKFLGETPRSRVSRIESTVEAAVAEAGVSPFEATFGGLGAFPSEDYIRVVWLGVRSGGEEMSRLQSAIEDRLVTAGFEPEDHDFTPHVTLARMSHAGGKALVQQVLRERDPEVGTTTVEEVRLTETELGPDGPEYSTVARFPLG